MDAATTALGDAGPDAVRVEVLAGGLGVTKGGFYWHFSDRAALLEAVLERWEQTSTQDLIDHVDAHRRTTDDPRRRLRVLFALAPSGDGLRVELAVRDWSRRDPAVAARLARVDDQRMGYLRTCFAPLCSGPDDAEARSLLAYSLLFGTHFIAARHQGRDRQDVVRDALALLLT